MIGIGLWISIRNKKELSDNALHFANKFYNETGIWAHFLQAQSISATIYQMFRLNHKLFRGCMFRCIRHFSNICRIWVFQKDIFKFVTPWFIHWCYLVCISLVDSTICFWSQIFLFGVTTKLQFGIHMQMTINGWA